MGERHHAPGGGPSGRERDMGPDTHNPGRQISRRALVAQSATLLGAGVLAACGTASTTSAPTAGTKKISGGTATFMATGDADRFQIRDNLMPSLLAETGV